MSRVDWAVAIVAVSLVSCVQDQRTVDFSGKWTMVPGSAHPPSSVRVGVGGLGEAFTVVQTAHALNVTTILPVLGETTAVYHLDGTETANPLKLGSLTVAARVSTASWERGTLVIRSTVDVKGEVTKSEQTWRLDGSDLVVEHTNSNESPTRARYRKN